MAITARGDLRELLGGRSIAELARYPASESSIGWRGAPGCAS